MSRNLVLQSDPTTNAVKTIRRVSKLMDKEADALTEITSKMLVQHEITFQKTVKLLDTAIALRKIIDIKMKSNKAKPDDGVKPAEVERLKQDVQYERQMNEIYRSHQTEIQHQRSFADSFEKYLAKEPIILYEERAIRVPNMDSSDVDIMDLSPVIKFNKRRHGGFIYPDSAKKA